jgi:hypothetical protein
MAYSSNITLLNFASNITTFAPNIQNVTNTYGVLVNVEISVEMVLNQSFLMHFTLSANHTDFIIISNGSLLQGQNVFLGLDQNKTLTYDASSTPIPTIHNGNTVLIQYITKVYEAVPLPPPPPPPFLLPSYLFDIKITALPSTVTYIIIFSQSFEANITAINKGIASDATISWQLLDMASHIVSSSSFTLFFKASETKALKITIPTPTTPGTYTVKVQVEKPTIAVATKTLTVIVISPYLIIAIFIIIALVICVSILKKTKRL